MDKDGSVQFSRSVVSDSATPWTAARLPVHRQLPEFTQKKRMGQRIAKWRLGKNQRDRCALSSFTQVWLLLPLFSQLALDESSLGAFFTDPEEFGEARGRKKAGPLVGFQVFLLSHSRPWIGRERLIYTLGLRAEGREKVWGGFVCGQDGGDCGRCGPIRGRGVAAKGTAEGPTGENRTQGEECPMRAVAEVANVWIRHSDERAGGCREKATPRSRMRAVGACALRLCPPRECGSARPVAGQRCRACVATGRAVVVTPQSLWPLGVPYGSLGPLRVSRGR